jgi:hypothetical protein
MVARSKHQSTRDRGLILPLVLVVSVVLGLVVVGVARYGTANLRYSQVTERRSDQLAAADAAMSYAVNLIKIGAADCIFNDQTIDLPQLVETFNGATGSVQCSQYGGGLDSAGLFAMVLTGQGVPSADYLVETAGGSVKEFGGPLFMERVDPLAFDLSNNNGILLKRSPLLHYDGTTPQCQAVSESVLDDDVDFDPDAIFGPICTADHWYNYGPGGQTFDEPPIAVSFDPAWVDSVAPSSGGSMPVYDGSRPSSYTAAMPLTGDLADVDKIVTVQGGYEDVLDPVTGLSCRVFEPGRYVRPPDVLNKKVYFKSGEYLFDFRTPTGTPTSFLSWAPASLPDSEFEFDKTTATAGALDPATGITAAISNPACQPVIDADSDYGVTFYMSGKAHIGLDTQAILEIMPRNQGTVADPLYVGVHALCDRSNSADDQWCRNSPEFAAPTLAPPPSDRQAPSSNTSNPALIWIKAGNVSEIVSNGLIYAPRAELEFRNVTNDAEVRLRGGAVIARATIDASASAENFEIGVASQDVDLDLYLLATGTDPDGGRTTIGSDVDLHYDEVDVDDRLDVLSWRVCATTGC